MERITQFHPEERVLDLDYPLYYDFIYICDGLLRESPLGDGATVKDWMRVDQISEIRNSCLSKREGEAFLDAFYQPKK